MRFSESEIVEDIFEHIRQLGGEFGEWHVGTAKEPQSPGFLQHSAGGLGEGFLYRETYTTYAADEVLEGKRGQEPLFCRCRNESTSSGVEIPLVCAEKSCRMAA